MKLKLWVYLFATVLLCGTARLVAAQTIQSDESVSGDLSSDPLSPTFNLVPGVNRWLGTIEPTAPSQADRWVATLPLGFEITNVTYSRAATSGGSSVLFDFQDPFFQIIATTTGASVSQSFSPPLTLSANYYVEIITDFNTAGRAWSVDIAVQESTVGVERSTWSGVKKLYD